jgi:CheY-like chemotaxis protein
MTNPVEELPRRLVPTPMRPLLGLTVLVVEDSRFASEALRLMCLHSGARLRRADCLAAARRHLGAYAPSVTLVDLMLPDGSGADLIRDLVARDSIAPVIATSGLAEGEAEARAAGAQGFLAKPVASLALFQQTILQALPPEARPRGPRAIAVGCPAPDRIALRDDLVHARSLITDRSAPGVLPYLAGFLEGLGRAASDRELCEAGRALGRALATGPGAEIDHLTRLLTARLVAAGDLDRLLPGR